MGRLLICTYLLDCLMVTGLIHVYINIHYKRYTVTLRVAQLWEDRTYWIVQQLRDRSTHWVIVMWLRGVFSSQFPWRMCVFVHVKCVCVYLLTYCHPNSSDQFCSTLYHVVCVCGDFPSPALDKPRIFHGQRRPVADQLAMTGYVHACMHPTL